MDQFPLLLSVVMVVKNQDCALDDLIRNASENLTSITADYELIIVDNASGDDSVETLRALAGETGYPNLQVYALTKEVDSDTASWVGLENALGDFVAVIDPLLDDVGFLREMLSEAVKGADVVFATNQKKPRQNLTYHLAHVVFNFLYKTFNGLHLTEEAPYFRLLSKQVVNFILQYPQPAVAYRHLPATAGFRRIKMEYTAKSLPSGAKHLGDSIHRGTRLLVSTTQGPMRLVTLLSLFGAVANLIYSVYVVVVGSLKADVAPGWVSMSLQQSGMFFLISLVLLVLGEYILQMASLSNEGPPYHVGQEFTSVVIRRREKLNIEIASSPATSDP